MKGGVKGIITAWKLTVGHGGGGDDGDGDGWWWFGDLLDGGSCKSRRVFSFFFWGGGWGKGALWSSFVRLRLRLKVRRGSNEARWNDF